MHINGKELISTSFKPATIEGRINYKAVQQGKSIVKSGSFKEFWFKLTGNLLFYFGLNSYGGIKGNVCVTRKTVYYKSNSLFIIKSGAHWCVCAGEHVSLCR